MALAALLLILLGLAVWRYCAYPGRWTDPVTWWMDMGPTGQAGWVQAAGGLLAIAAALAIGLYQTQKSRELAQDQAKASQAFIQAERDQAARVKAERMQVTALWLGVRLYGYSQEARRLIELWQPWKRLAADPAYRQLDGAQLKSLATGLRFNSELGDLGGLANVLQFPKPVAFKLVSASEAIGNYSGWAEFTLAIMIDGRPSSEVFNNNADKRIGELRLVIEKTEAAYDVLASTYGLNSRAVIQAASAQVKLETAESAAGEKS